MLPIIDSCAQRKHFPYRALLFWMLFLAFATCSPAQQLPDTTHFFTIANPAYPAGEGPVICVDAGHQNFHTLKERYAAFGNILRADGYRLVSQSNPITQDALDGCAVFVISNPLHPSNTANWQLPTPSAFSESEIAALESWVSNGGGLFLIADHMPFAGAAADLGKVFGFEFLNSFAMDNRRRSYERFTKAAGLLHETPLTAGIDSVVTFTGSAFVIPEEATPLLSLDQNYTVLIPERAWEFTDETPYQSGEGLHQLAYRTYGNGKVVVSGEAAMFSAQLAGPQQVRVGLNDPEARRNIDLLRRLVGWLVR